MTEKKGLSFPVRGYSNTDLSDFFELDEKETKAGKLGGFSRVSGQEKTSRVSQLVRLSMDNL